MAIQVQHTDTQTVNHDIKALIYGRAGTGKTRLCATAPAPIILSAEHGLLSLRKMHVPYIKIPDFKALVDVCNWLSRSNETKQYRTVCLDTISEIADIVLVEEQRKTKDGRKAYYEMGAQVLQLVRYFRDTPNKHIVIVAQQTYVKDEFTGQMLHGPLFPGQAIANKVPYFFDELWQMCNFKGADGQRIEALKTQADGESDAKDRSGALKPWEEPNLSNVFSRILAN